MEPINDIKRTKLLLLAKMDAAFKVNLDATFACLEQFSQSLSGTVRSEVPILDGVDISFKKVNRAFAFSTGPLKWIGPYNQYSSSAFGFGKPFSIHWQDKTLLADNRGGNNVAKPGQGFISSGELHDLRMLAGGDDTYYRAIFLVGASTKWSTNYMKRVDFCCDAKDYFLSRVR